MNARLQLPDEERLSLPLFVLKLSRVRMRGFRDVTGPSPGRDSQFQWRRRNCLLPAEVTPRGQVSIRIAGPGNSSLITHAFPETLGCGVSRCTTSSLEQILRLCGKRRCVEQRNVYSSAPRRRAR
ncbi:hypothetical protein NDU88_004590 [Pleurodeles waltl]|uniref:Uncharacterized protein n=1 Tax=Pleurodeles waltl TaxID=8319 RepID=A0AAV7UFP5_PLEWA|nr:hypothetical protein NDU88_004590 [Pleurodeles waltl]